MFDAAGVLERSFTPVEGGYLYYPSRWSNGYLVTPAEYENLVNDWRRVVGFKGILKLVGMFVAVVLIDALLVLVLGGSPLVATILLYATIALAVGYILWKSTAANRLVKGREPAAPPRSSKQTEAAMGRALGRPLAVWMGFVSVCFAGWAMFIALSKPLWGVPLLVVAGVAAFFNIRIAIRAFGSKN